MSNIKKINLVFLITVIMPFTVLFLPIGHLIENDLANIILSQLLYVLPTMGYLIISKQKIRESLRIHKVSFSNVILLILFAFVIMPIISLISAITLLFSDNVISTTINNIADQYPAYIGILFIGIIPAIFEETVYRGVFYNEYRKLSPRCAIILSALLFGLLHQNLNQFGYAFFIGIIFTLVIEATDSILSTMIIHFVINTFSVASAYLLPKLLRFLEKIDTTGEIDAEKLLEVSSSQTITKVEIIQSIYSYMIPAAICAVLAFIIYRTIARNAKRWEDVKQIVHTKSSISVRSFLSAPLVIGMGICAAFIIYGVYIS